MGSRMSHTTIWEDLQSCENQEKKISLPKINKTGKFVSDWKQRESFKEEKTSPALLIRTSLSNVHHNSNVSVASSPQILLRSSRSNSTGSHANVFSSRIIKTPQTFSTKPSFSPVVRRTSRCNSGASCQGRIALGPDGTIGFRKGRSGKYLRVRSKSNYNLNRAFAGMSFFKRIEGNGGNISCRKKDSSSNFANTIISLPQVQHKREHVDKINLGNVLHFSSDSRQNSPTVSQAGLESQTNDIGNSGKSVFNRCLFDFSSCSSQKPTNSALAYGRLKGHDTLVTQSLKMTSRRLSMSLKPKETRSISLSSLSSRELADEEALLDARIHRLSQSVGLSPVIGMKQVMENNICRNSCKSRFLDFDSNRPHQSRYLESFSR